jgi:DNA-binding IclR family transcriptional regulator
VEQSVEGKSHQQTAGIQTMLRGFALIEFVAGKVRTVSQISEHLGTPRSTTHRLLRGLVLEGYLRHVRPDGYLLGPKLIGLGAAALEQMSLTTIARPHLQRLADQTCDTVHFGVLVGQEVMYLDKISGTRGLEMRSRVGHRMPLATTGIGKALTLALPREDWAGLYRAARQMHERSQLPPPNALSLQQYESAVLEGKTRGYVFDLEENEHGIRCVASSVHDAAGGLIAALSVASTLPYMPLERLDQLGPVVRATADAISRELGWTGTP